VAQNQGLTFEQDREISFFSAESKVATLPSRQELSRIAARTHFLTANDN
jgi:hypothetical protein